MLRLYADSSGDVRPMERARILVVDDEQEICGIVQQLLTQLGHDVDTVLSGEAALDMLVHNTYDVLIVDIVLVTMSGFEVMAEAKRRDPGVEVIILTGFGPADRAREAVRRGASAYLQKPISGRVLCERVAEALAKRQFTRVTEDVVAQVKVEKRRLEDHVRQLTGLYDFSQRLNLAEDYEEIVDAILGGVCELARAVCGYTLIVEEDAARLYVQTRSPGLEAYVHSVRESVAEFWEGLGEEIPNGQIEVTHRSVESQEEMSQHGESLVPLFVPLATKNRIIGALGVTGTREERHFVERLLYMLSGHAAAAIMQASLHYHTQILATTDALTGLYNRRTFLDRLRQEVDRAIRYDSCLSLIFVDSDTLKTINDTYGHQDGDLFIRQIASLLRNRLRDTDIIARYGGDEFPIILPEAKLGDAAAVGEELRRAVEGHTFRLRRVEASGTISVGVASFPEHSDRTMYPLPTREHIIRWAEDLFERADRAMYRAKEQGKNQVYAE